MLSRHRSVVWLAVLAAELVAVSLAFDARQPLGSDASGMDVGLGHAGAVARFLSVAIAAAVLLLVAGGREAFANATSPITRGTSAPAIWVIAHLLAYGLFFTVSALLFAQPTMLEPADRPTATLIWLCAGAAMLASWLLVLAPAGTWWTWAYRQRALLPALAAAAFATLVAYQAQGLWQGLATITLRMAHGLLALAYDDVMVDMSAHLLGVGDFVVAVGAACSGYEGIGLMAAFTGLYLFAFRRDFRFPLALWLVPVGLLAVWLFNVLRIAALVTIGAEISPALALEGFHSQAGWISFLLVSGAFLFVVHRSNFARHCTGFVRATLDDNVPAAMLLPLVVVLFLGLVTSAGALTIDWLYPLRVVGGIAVLALCWRTLGLRWPRMEVSAILVGLAVAGLWIALAVADPVRDRALTSAWLAQPPWLAWCWLGVRLFGAVLIVPVVEELAFRGYLLARLSGEEPRTTGAMPLHWPALVLTAFGFGILHDAWIAGTVAGLAYGLLRMRGADIWLPIAAHATTNGALAAYVLVTGTWSIW